MLRVPSRVAVIAIGAVFSHKNKFAFAGLRDASDLAIRAASLIGFERLKIPSAAMRAKLSVRYSILERSTSARRADQAVERLGWF